MSLMTLPPELVSCVLVNIPSQPTLCKLARCSHQLYLYTKPHLYRQVIIDEDFKLGEQENGNLRRFASVLFRRPDLAGLIRHFELRITRPMRIFAQPEHFRIWTEPERIELARSRAVSVDQAWKAAIRASSWSEEEENNWLELCVSPQAHFCPHEAILALLLPAMLKLEKLVLNLEITWSDTHYLERMIRRAARRERPFDTQPPFEFLKVFDHNKNIVFPPRSAGFIASLLKLPAMQKISGAFGAVTVGWGSARRGFKFGEINKSMEKNLIKLATSSSPLHSLDLAASTLSIEELGYVLGASKTLKNLSFQFWEDCKLTLLDLRHALEAQKNCLESLSLDYIPYGNLSHRSTARKLGPMPSFISFSALKVFKTNADLLKARGDWAGIPRLITIFPPNLETLHLTRFDTGLENLSETLEHLLAQKSLQQIPSWNRLVLEISCLEVLERGTHDTFISKLSGVTAAQGVSIEVIVSSESLFHDPVNLTGESTEDESVFGEDEVTNEEGWFDEEKSNDGGDSTD